MTATITINGTLILINFIIGFLLGRKLASKKGVDKKVKKSETSDPMDIFFHPGDALKEFEPIKSYCEEYDKDRDTEDALKIAILRNLIDNGYPYADGSQSIRNSSKLPNLLELQNIIKLKPIIKEIEDQYKRFEEVRDKTNAEKDLIESFVNKVLKKLKEDLEMQDLAISRGVYSSKFPKSALYDLLSSPEAKGIVERCINDVLKDSNNDLTVGNNNGQE